MFCNIMSGLREYELDLVTEYGVSSLHSLMSSLLRLPRCILPTSLFCVARLTFLHMHQMMLLLCTVQVQFVSHTLGLYTVLLEMRLWTTTEFCNSRKDKTLSALVSTKGAVLQLLNNSYTHKVFTMSLL